MAAHPRYTRSLAGGAGAGGSDIEPPPSDAVIVGAIQADRPAWLALAREVEPLFGPMVDDPAFHAALERAILDGRAFCIRAGSSEGRRTLCGGVLISRTHNEIGWLAVAETYRGRGYGSALLVHALAHLDPTCPVTVTTFTASVPAGRPARRLYERFGFRNDHLGDPTPTGVPTVVMVRPVGS